MINLLLENPLLLLVVVAALGYVLGNVRVKGSSLGVAAVLFAGLGVGALHPDLKLPDFTTLLGLVLFVYTIGLSSGPGFFASFRRKGLRDNLFVVAVLLVAFGIVLAAHHLLGMKPELSAGLFAGSLTNTPALANLLEFLGHQGATGEALNEPVIGYSIAYPVGVVGMILTLFLLQRLWKVDYEKEAETLKEPGLTPRKLEARSIRVTRPEITGFTIHEMLQAKGWDVIFGRIRHEDEKMSLAGDNSYLSVGDRISVIGSPEDLDKVTTFLGEPSEEQLELARSEYDFRRIFVSNPRVTGHRLGDLNLLQQYGALVTRVRRGDVEFLANEHTMLEPGDRVRVVARPENMAAVSKFFGDSYRALSEVNLLTLSLGLMAGLLIGMIPITLPGGVVFRLGMAGGPLIAGLILGKLGRTGRLVWYLPYSGNLVLRQFGLVLFFAGVGTKAGHAFFYTLGSSGGLAILAAGAAVTLTVALLTLVIGYKVLRIPMGQLSGLLAGLQTQPAVLSFALDQSKNELPNLGYATVFPVATITKIFLAQLLLTLL